MKISPFYLLFSSGGCSIIYDKNRDRYAVRSTTSTKGGTMRLEAKTLVKMKTAEVIVPDHQKRIRGVPGRDGKIPAQSGFESW